MHPELELVTLSAPAGSCVINADQAGSVSYAPAPRVQQVVSTGPGSQSISFTTTPSPAPKIGDTYAVAATASSGLPVAISIDATSTSGCTYSSVTGVTFSGPGGSCVIDANQAGSATYLPAPQVHQVVTVGLVPQTITFLTTPPANPKVGGTYAVSASGGGSGNPVVLTIDAASTSGCTYDASSGRIAFSAPAGTCVIDANQAGNGAYAAAPTEQQGITVAPAATSATPVVIDTDIYSNTDDEGALAVALGLQLQGAANVLAIGVNTRTSRPAVSTNSWKCAAAITQFYGFPDIPIGSDMPDNGTTVNSPDIVGPCAALASPSTPKPVPVVALYRKALASQPDGSVVMVGIGYEENLANLLASPPDSISPLSGSALVAKKVKMLVLMGGGYPSRTYENNFGGNPTAAESVAANWPTKVVYSGYEVGYGTFTGHTLSTVHPANSPVRVAYEALVGAGKNNRSFDLSALYHGLRPNDPVLSEVGPGTNVINSSGGNTFTPGTGHAYYLKLSSATTLASSLEGLLDVLPGTTPQAVAFTSTPTSPAVGSTYAPAAAGGGSGNPVSFSIDPSSTSGCTYDWTTGLVTFSAPTGTCVINADQGGTTVYAAAPRVRQTVTVTPATQSITFTTTPPAHPVVGGTYAVAATASSVRVVATRRQRVDLR